MLRVPVNVLLANRTPDFPAEVFVPSPVLDLASLAALDLLADAGFLSFLP